MRNLLLATFTFCFVAITLPVTADESTALKSKLVGEWKFDAKRSIELTDAKEWWEPYLALHSSGTDVTITFDADGVFRDRMVNKTQTMEESGTWKLLDEDDGVLRMQLARENQDSKEVNVMFKGADVAIFTSDKNKLKGIKMVFRLVQR